MANRNQRKITIMEFPVNISCWCFREAFLHEIKEKQIQTFKHFQNIFVDIFLCFDGRDFIIPPFEI